MLAWGMPNIASGGSFPGLFEFLKLYPSVQINKKYLLLFHQVFVISAGKRNIFNWASGRYSIN